MAIKTASTGQFMIPTSPAAGTAVSSGAANTYTTNYVQLTAATSAALYITGASGFVSSTTRPTYMHLQIATGSAGAEAIIGQLPGLYHSFISGTTGTSFSWYTPAAILIPVANGARIAAKTADSTGGLNHLITLECIGQANVVDAGVVEAVDISTIKTQAVTAAAGVTFPSSIQSSTTFPTNFSALTISAATGAVRVDAGTITTVSGNVSGSVGSVTGAVSSVTAAVTLPAIPANFITAAGISAGAYSGVTFSSGQTVASVSGAVSSVTAAVTVGSGTITTVSGNVSGSVGSVTGAVSSVTAAVSISSGQTVATVTNPVTISSGQTIATVSNPVTISSGQSVASVTGAVSSVTAAVTVGSGTITTVSGNVSGSVGSVTGLTASNLDTTVSSRLATTSYAAPDNSSIAAVKTQTDKMTFSVANKMDSNILAVNNTTVTGAGTASSPWGP